ncbi:MAG: carboxymuconolactone decarboxylase family protein [Bacteroidota bacterium]
MRTIEVLKREQADAVAQPIFDNLKKAIGMVPNLYATIGYSGETLRDFLTFQTTVESNSFTKKEAEAINLVVSQVNGCAYCLAAHTAIAKMNGFSEEETLQLRDASIADARLSAITKLAQSLTINRGNAAVGLVEDFFAQGFTEKHLIELIGVVAAKTFSNYVHNTTQVPVDFPAAKPLPVTA